LRLYSYQNLEVPAGVELADAADVMDESEAFLFDRSFSAFSNIFRYRLLFDQGGWWIDSDVYCQLADVPQCSYAWAAQDARSTNGAILKFPARDPALGEILTDAAETGGQVSRWGQLGPDLLTMKLSPKSFEGHFGTTEDFYPVHWLETHFMWLPGSYRWVAKKCNGSSFVHLWASMLERLGVDLHKMPPRGSYLRALYDEAGFSGVLPELDDEEYRRTILSMKDYLGSDWVSPTSLQLLGYDVSAPQTGDHPFRQQ
jgi:hypothetical protein